MQERVVNLRLIFFIFLGLMTGIIFAYLFSFEKISINSLHIILYSLFAVAVLWFIYACVTDKYNKKFKAREFVSVRIKIVSICFIITMLLGFVVTNFWLGKIINIKSFNDDVVVSGRVCDYVDDEATYKKFIVEDCIIVSGENTYNSQFKICVYSTKNINVQLGDNVAFVGKLQSYNPDYNNDFLKLIQDVGYTSFVNADDIIVDSGKAELKDIIKRVTKELLIANLNYDNANIAYTILFGEKQGLSDKITHMFSYAGISHILAVSGLHIGLLFSLIMFYLKRLKVNKYLRLFLLISILLFYSYLCSFTPSVCRASIMCMVLALCKTFGQEYDRITSLSIAGVIILLINPLSLFTISFQLSFLCIFAIISLMPFFRSIFMKLKFPKFLAELIGMSIATNICILPVCINSFSSVSLIGIFTNLIVLPIFNIAYIFLFFIVVIVLIFKFLGFLLFIPNLLLHIIKVFANVSVNLSFLTFNSFNIGYEILCLLTLFCLILHFVNLKMLPKGIVSFILISIMFGLFTYYNVPIDYINNNIIINYQYNSNVVFYLTEEEQTLIGSNIEEYMLANQLKELRINEIDNIIAYDFELNQIDNLIEICNKYNIKNVYMPARFDYDSVTQKFNKVVLIDEKFEIDNLNIEFIEYKKEIIGVNFSVLDIGGFLLPNKDLTKTQLTFLQNEYSGVDYLLISKYNNDINLEILQPRRIICQEQIFDNKIISMQVVKSLRLCDV